MAKAWRIAILPTAVLGAALACALFAAPPAATNPRTIENFSLRDFRGKVHALADYGQSKLVVIAFIGCECPVAKLCAPRLAKLAHEFEPRGVKFLAIDSNCQDSLAELSAYAQLHGIDFPVLKDAGNVVADQFGAARTPEVFLLDADRRVRYRGRVDDQALVGRQRPRASREDLKQALEELLAGRPVSVPETQAVGCHIGRVPTPKAGASAAADDSDPPAVTYSRQIARLLQSRCVDCHREGEIAPFPLTSYAEVVGWGETIREVVADGRMPPWLANPRFGHFANDPRLTDDEKQLVYDWLDAGAPEGDPADLPEPRTFTIGWQIPQPDQVISIAPEPVAVPAEGVVKYQYFLVDPGFQEDRWIQAAECRPGNRRVVHHIVVNFIPPGARPKIGLSGPTVGFAPGIPPVRMPEGMAMFVPAGSKILFQMHYTPNGSPQQDRSSLGMVFADPATVRDRVESFGAANVLLELPPGAPDVVVESQHRFGRDVRLLSMMPHMHLRGKAFRFEVQYPDGSHEVLLDVPRYDFNWQLRYELAEPKRLPEGTLLTCTAHFDNSASNPVNPDPTARVRWGEQTWDEMMIGYFGAVAEGDSQAPLIVRDDAASQTAAREFVRQGIETLGGRQRLAAEPVLSFEMRGTLYLNGLPMPFDGSTTLQPAAARLRMAVSGTGFRFALVLDNQQGWFKLNDRLLDLPAEALDEHRERLHAETVALLYPVWKDDAYKLALIAEAKLGDKPADGVLVRHAAHRDVRLYFARESHLLEKIETEINESGKTIQQETLLADYVEIQGVQRPRRATIRWDGADRALRQMSAFQTQAEPAADTFSQP